MNTALRLCSLSFVWVLFGCAEKPLPDSSAEPMARPNFLLIVVDDMGYNDLGSFGSEIPTPNLDGLALAGTRLTNFQVAPTCSPTRSMLLTGVDSHKAGLGNMLEELSPNQKGQPGYEGYLNDRVQTLPGVLRDHGYATIISGKWHLGKAESQSPHARGFDKSFSLIPGGASHFADMRPAYAPNPTIKALYRQDGQKLESLPESFEYSSQYYVDYMIEALRDLQDSEQPFFAYLSFTAPHWPLQAPDAAIDQFKGAYDEGYDVLRSERLAGGIRAGVLPVGTKVSPAPAAYKPWNSLSENTRLRQAREMEVYAAMISEVDRHTGRLLDFLRESGAIENTVIFFLADNGAEGHDLDETWPADLFPDIRKTIDESHDFSFEQIGRPGSYSLYGHGWGWAGSPAFNLYKAFPTEGGTRAAAFAHYPRWQGAPDIHTGLVSVKDIMPTFLELASIQPSKDDNFEPISGLSQVAVLSDKSAPSNSDSRVLATELFGKRAVRKGDWKIVHMPKPYGGDRWRLYNLRDDLGESTDLSEIYPEKFDEMIALWNVYQEENSVILPDWVSGY